MRTRTLAVGVLCSGLVLAGCSGGSGDSGDKGSKSATARKTKAAAAPELPAGFRRIGGTKNGFTAGVPKSWKPLNLNELSKARAALVKSGTSPAAAKQMITTLKANNAVLVLDPKSAQTVRFAANLNGFCQAGTAPSAAQSKAQLQQIGGQHIVSQNVTVGGQSGHKTTYYRKVGTVMTVGVQYQITGDSGKVCFITMTAKKGTKTPFSAIGATIHAL
ncbi:hypothetical protein [Actinoallomurus rhizosphaericola]|uniref:hypothetical protein n=1 Tax=Actinoallomurus rhizosphaericola TaxID=2952536 RepID=UPI002093953D|nr:hypothetical protein [Actinoallomurus rhizosphaericola]MCO5995939.1 hypothetical protein [Actinoallomurus rhizosphaericola]